MKANDVIRIGRRRRRQASITASSRSLPSASMSRANSTIRMAFLAASPTSTMKPIWVRMLTSWPMMRTPTVAASKHIGTIRMTENGRLQLTNCAARTKQNDGDRRPQPAILRGQHQIDEQHADREHEQAGICAIDLLIGQVGPV